jgi:hypothetical protein
MPRKIIHAKARFVIATILLSVTGLGGVFPFFRCKTKITFKLLKFRAPEGCIGAKLLGAAEFSPPNRHSHLAVAARM